MNLERTVRTLNRLLAAELGSKDGVSPTYQWFLCRDLFYVGPQFHEVLGNLEPIYDYVCACGVNKAVHHPDCRSLVIPKERMGRTSTAFGLPDDNWVIAVWQPKTLDHQPPGGFYVPITVDGVMMAFPPNEPPTKELTDIFIASMRHRDERSPEQQERDAATAEAEYDARDKAAKTQMFRDILPTFGQIPGSKDCEVSYPSPVHDPALISSDVCIEAPALAGVEKGSN